MENRYYFSDNDWRFAGRFIKAGLVGLKGMRYGYDGTKIKNYVEFDSEKDYNKFIDILEKERGSGSFASPRTTWILQWEMQGRLSKDGKEMFRNLLGLD